MPTEYTEEMNAKRRQSEFDFWMDEYVRQWLEANLGADDLNYMKSVQAWLWGPGLILSETEYLRGVLSRDPSRAEVIKAIDRTVKLLEPCNEAMFADPEFIARAEEYRRQNRASPT